jgi:hypothetical protein
LNKVKELSSKLDKDSNIGFLINQLFECYELSLNDEPEKPDNESLKEIFLLSDFKIAK